MTAQPQLDIQAITPEQAATILGKLIRRRITADMIQRDIEAGMPVNPDGTINLIHYAAWLNREATHGRN